MAGRMRRGIGRTYLFLSKVDGFGGSLRDL
jgi:hypothetical protein